MHIPLQTEQTHQANKLPIANVPVTFVHGDYKDLRGIDVPAEVPETSQDLGFHFPELPIALKGGLEKTPSPLA